MAGRRAPKGLLDHRCTRHRFAGGAVAAWEFVRGGEPVRLDAIVQRIGVIHTFDGLLAPALADGRLEPVLEYGSERFSGPFLHYAGRRHVPPPLHAFIRFLRSPACDGVHDAPREPGRPDPAGWSGRPPP